MPSDLCNRSYSLAVALTVRQKKFELPRRLAADEAGRASPEFWVVMAAVLRYAAVYRRHYLINPGSPSARRP